MAIGAACGWIINYKVGQTFLLFNRLNGFIRNDPNQPKLCS